LPRTVGTEDGATAEGQDGGNAAEGVPPEEGKEADGGAEDKKTTSLIYGPPDDHNEEHRPESFDEIKGCILDKTGTFRFI